MADRIATLAADVARRIAAQLPDLTPEMTAMFINIIPEFHHDQSVRRLMVASTSSDLSAVVDMLMLAVTSRIALLVNGNIDRAIEGPPRSAKPNVSWEERSDATRAAQVRAVLSRGSQRPWPSKCKGLALRGWCIGAVAWVSASDEAAHLHGVSRLLAETSGQMSMIMHADSNTIWA